MNSSFHFVADGRGSIANIWRIGSAATIKIKRSVMYVVIPMRTLLASLL
jgi:hypothetical protein